MVEEEEEEKEELLKFNKKKKNLIMNPAAVLDSFYRDLKARIHGREGGNKTISILVHVDVDSICTLRMLVGLFKQDSLAYECIPIASYKDLRQIRDPSRV